MYTERLTKKMLPFLMLVLLLMLTALPVYAARPSLNKSKVTLVTGKTVKLSVKGTSSRVKWSSSKKSVASVSKTGLVTAKKKGTARIKAKVGKKVLTCKVTVKKNYWRSSIDPSRREFWPSTLAYCNNSQLCFVKARPYELYYNNKGYLIAKIALLNEGIGYNYHLTDMHTIIGCKGRIIAEGDFSFDYLITPVSYGTVTVTFDKGTTKEVIDLTKQSTFFRISTN